MPPLYLSLSVPVTGFVTLIVIYGFLVLIAFWAPPNKPRGWPWLLRTSVVFFPFATLAIVAMWTGRNLDEGHGIVRLLFGIGLGPFIICPVIGAGIGWVIWSIPPLRVSIEALWLFVLRYQEVDVVRQSFPFNLTTWMVVWAVAGFIFSFLVGMNMNFQWGETGPGAYYP